MQLPEGFVLDTPKAPSAPNIIRGNPKPVDPYKVQDQAMQGDRFEMDVDKNARDERNDKFDRAAKLRKDFENIPETSKYKTIIGTYAGALGANDSAEGDQLLINSYAQMLNPTSTVMLGEYQATEQNQATIDQVLAKVKRELKFDGAGRLAPESRMRIYSEMQNLAKTTNSSYNARRDEFKGLAGRYGFDPEEIVGSHPGAPFQEKIQSFWDKTRDRADDFNEDKPIGSKGGGTPLIDPKDGISVIPDDGTTTTGFSPDKYVSDELKAKNDALNDAWLGGEIRTLPELFAKAESLGLDISNTDKRNLALQIRRGERGSFAPRPDKERTGVQKAASDFIDSPVGAFGVGSLNALTLGGSDELIGMIAGEDAGQRTQDVKEYLRENRPAASIAGEVGGSILGLGMLPAGVATAVGTKGGATAVGAAYGALDNNDNRVLGALGGAVIGRYAPQAVEAGINKVSPYAQRAVNALAPAFDKTKGIIPGFKPNALASEIRGNANVIRAGMDENIPVRLPEVAPSQRGRYQELKSSDGGGPVVAKAQADDLSAMEARLAEIGGTGTAKEGFNAGTDIQSAVSREKDKIALEARAFYNRAELQAPGFKAPATQVVQDIDAKISNIKSITPDGNEGHIALLDKIKNNFAKTGLSTEAVQANRQIARQHVKANNLAFTPQEVELLDVIKVAGSEHAQALRASGNEAAASSLERANAKWSEYSDFKKQIVQTLVGNDKQPVSPEQAATRLMSMVKSGGDSGKFARVYRAMDPAEKDDFRALVAENLGKGANGEFTPAMLARNLDQKQANYQTLREVFGPDGFKSLMNLKVLAAAKRDTANAPIGTSTRREIGGAKRLLLSFFGIAGGAGAGGVGGAVAGGMAIPAIAKMGERRAARLMLNKDVTHFIRSMPETTNPRVINSMFDKLQKIAPANSVAATDIASLKQALIESFGKSPDKLAAQEQETN